MTEQGIGKSEKQFRDSFFAEVCGDVVVTRCDEWVGHERDRFRFRFADCFAGRLPRFHFVSGLKGLQARHAADVAGLEAASITLLEARIRELADRADQTKSIRQSLIGLASDLACWLGEFRGEQGRPLERWWRPDNWGRWKVAALCDGLHERLSASVRP